MNHSVIMQTCDSLASQKKWGWECLLRVLPEFDKPASDAQYVSTRRYIWGESNGGQKLEDGIDGGEVGQQSCRAPAGGVCEADWRRRGRYAHRRGFAGRAAGPRTRSPCDRQNRVAPPAQVP